MRCPKCQVENREGRRFCAECGASLNRACPSCGFSNEPNEKFCGGCGQPLASPQQVVTRFSSPEVYTPKHLAEKILTSKSAVEGERKQVTVLFADMKGSMELLADRDPEEARKLLDPVIEHMMEAVHRYEGTVSNLMGDGIMALFGAPLAHEDHAVRACYAALRMQESVKRYAEGVRRTEGVPIQIRVGLNSGEVVVGAIGNDLKMDYTAIGQTTHLAARMEQMAMPCSIMVSDDTYELTEGYFRFKGLGPVQVRGLTGLVGAYELEGAGPLRTRLEVATSRGLVRFVGRQAEMEQMRRALELAKGGHGQIAAVVGEPGVGKSRLCYEFKNLEGSGCKILETYSVSHGKAYPYLPITELLKSYLQIALEDDEQTRREKVAGKVAVLDRSLQDTLPYILFLLGIPDRDSSLQQMDASIRRQRTFDAIKRLLLRESLSQPVIVIFEDLHWIDGKTQAFLDVLSESVASARILLLVDYRPEYRHSWGGKTYYTQIRLDPLEEQDAEELLTALLGSGDRFTPVRRLILEKTEGNPFFMEEAVQTLAEEKVLSGERGKYRLEKPAGELQIPPTVQVALASRIDRLGSEEKGLLQTLAVMGKKFSLSLLKTVVEKPEDELSQSLSQLKRGELIYEQPAFPEMEYTFKHALTQEVAYNSVLTERRKGLHERAARAIEELYRDRLEEHYGDLARHYSRSGNIERAVEYLKLAGQQAAQRSANAEAVSHLTTALELLKALPDTRDRAQQELLVQTTLGPALSNTKGPAAPEVLHVYARARELCQQVGETPQRFQVLRGLWYFYLHRVELQTARELGEQLLTLAQHVGDPALLLEAHYSLGNTLNYLGEFATARSHLDQGIVLYDRQQHSAHAFRYGQDPGVICHAYAALTLWWLGYPEQAVRRSHKAVTLARELAHPFSLGIALVFAAWLHLLRRDGSVTQQWADAAIALAAEHGFTVLLAQGTIYRGWALAERYAEPAARQGQREEGIAQMQQGLEAWRATGAKVFRPYGLALLAEASAKLARHEAGLTLLGEALGMRNDTEERRWDAELYRLKGELLRARVTEQYIEAETCFRQALDIARHQQAKSWELRAATSLARLWQRQGRRAAAHQVLAEVYGWFTEGFDTADLKEAQALLEELS
jgi:class 3 adenylate cyclase/predicted ATPase